MKKIILFVLALLLLVSLTACKEETKPSASPTETAGTSESPSPTIDNTTPPPADVEIGEAAFAETYEFEAGDGVVRGSVDLAYPTVTSDVYPEGARLLSEHFENEMDSRKEGFVTDLQLLADGGQPPDIPFQSELTVTFRVESNRNGFVSFRLITERYAGGQHSVVNFEGLSFSLDKATRISFADLFAVSQEEAADAVKALILKQMEDNIAAADISPYFAEYPALVDATFAPERFVITEEGLRFFFDVYDIAPYSSGVPEFLVPFADLGEVINPEILP
ncbi:DUF3298 and DUF4163 domain-containing protein [Oscillospiraceae bacterium OttesenSCG-928-G22]|nr:DUF3298 and DUF4163 domain-containing protein [Oscillospiraceae bacterium OttesenSCG-928-G22]